MKKLLVIVLCIVSTAAFAQKKKTTGTLDASKPVSTIEVSCGQCQFKLPGEGCDLAVRIGENAFYVDGTGINEHGDAHAKEGFCNSVRKAEVQGELENDRYKVTYFRLLPVAKQ